MCGLGRLGRALCGLESLRDHLPAEHAPDAAGQAAPAIEIGIEFLDREQIDEGIGERSEEHTSELQSLMRISYAVSCLKKKKNRPLQPHQPDTHHTPHNTTQQTDTHQRSHT